MSNGELIRTASDEELAKQIMRCVLSDFYRVNVIGIHPFTEEEWIGWLKTEVKT